MIDPLAKSRKVLALRLFSISKRFGNLLANNAIDLSLHEGELLALLGENGAGKTTLMNILFGQYLPDHGSIEVYGKQLPKGNSRAALEAGIGMVHQHFTLVENMTVHENIVLGTKSMVSLHPWQQDTSRKIEKLSSSVGLKVDLDATVANLSVGERQRVEILKALYRDARILILDEPTAVLTPFEIKSLFLMLRNLLRQGLSVIFISHKLNEAMEFSDRVVVLRKGQVAGERLTSETNPGELASLMIGTEIEKPTAPESAAVGSVALQLKDLFTAAPELRINLVNASLTIRCGEIIGLAGVSGNGQAALAALISGTLGPARGTMKLFGKNLDRWSPQTAVSNRVGRIPEDRLHTGMIGNMSITENVISEDYRSTRFSRLGILNQKSAKNFAQSIVENYDVQCMSIETPVRLLSGGNIQKLILGRALANAPDIIIANQPSRGLDVGAVTYVHQQLLKARKRGAAILLISDDLEEILQISDRISVISSGSISPPTKRGELSIEELGTLMAQQQTNQVDALDEA